jgi:hypothetical protein
MCNAYLGNRPEYRNPVHSEIISTPILVHIILSKPESSTLSEWGSAIAI